MPRIVIEWENQPDPDVDELHASEIEDHAREWLADFRSRIYVDREIGSTWPPDRL